MHIKQLIKYIHPGISFQSLVCLLLWGILFGAAFPCPWVLASDTSIAVVISRKIRPYIQVSDGIVNKIANGGRAPEVIFLSSDHDNGGSALIEGLNDRAYEVVVAVGPEAAVLIWGLEDRSMKMYTAVLDPDTLKGIPSDACGIPLRLPVNVQLEQIDKTFDQVARIGLIYDPRHNQWFFEQARASSLKHAFEIVPLKVASKNQIPGILKKKDGQIDVIWMIPDQTVISEKIIQYVIKQGIYHDIGVIGYNSFFSRSGALFSFEFDYEELGDQTAEMIISFLKTGACRKEPAVFKTVVNQKIADKIGIRVEK